MARQPLTKAQRREIRSWPEEKQLELIREELHQEAEIWWEYARTVPGERDYYLDKIFHGELMLRPPQR